MKRRILASGVMILCVFVPLTLLSDEENEAGKGPAAKEVMVTVDYGDGAQKRFPKIPWKKNMTAFDATMWAAKHPRGVAIERQGKGSFTLVTKIDDLKNGGAAKKNWIFRVNDELGDKSCGVFSLQAGDRVLWSFEKYR